MYSIKVCLGGCRLKGLHLFRTISRHCMYFNRLHITKNNTHSFPRLNARDVISHKHIYKSRSAIERFFYLVV